VALSFGWEHQRVFQLNDVMGARSVDNIQTYELATLLREIDLVGTPDHVVDNNVVGALKSDLGDVVFGIINNPNQRQPLCLDLVADSKGSHLDLGAHALELFRQEIEERLPLCFI